MRQVKNSLNESVNPNIVIAADSNPYIKMIKEIATSSKYTKWYINIIYKGLQRLIYKTPTDLTRKSKELLGYAEIHHIFPKCWCSDAQKKDINNLVALTAKEHFICHHILSKMFIKDSKEYKSMISALNRFFTKSKRDKTKVFLPRRYEYVRAELARVISERNSGRRDFHGKHRIGVAPWNKGLTKKDHPSMMYLSILKTGKPRLDLKGKPAKNKGVSVPHEYGHYKGRKYSMFYYEGIAFKKVKELLDYLNLPNHYHFNKLVANSQIEFIWVDE